MKLYNKLMTFVSIAALLAGCNSADEPTFREIDPIQPDAAMSNMLDSYRKTAQDVFSQMADSHNEGNLAYSPISMYMTMSMLSAGASDVCLDELLEFLNYSDTEKLHDYNNQLINNLPYVDSNTTFKMANSAWLNNKLTIKEEFNNTLSTKYLSEVLAMPEENVGKAINEWISEKTSGIIKSHFEDNAKLGDICLVDALYFKAPWNETFKKEKTSRERFNCQNGNEVTVEMMKDESKSNAKYADVDGVKVLQMPFGNGNFVATFILPAQNVSVRDFVKTADFQKLTSKLSSVPVNVWLPKFNVEKRNDLKSIMEQMGYKELFKANYWPKLTTINLPFEIRDIYQSVAITIDEEGGKVATATNVNGSYGSPGAALNEFKANRPFFYMISQKSCDLPIIMGTIENL